MTDLKTIVTQGLAEAKEADYEKLVVRPLVQLLSDINEEVEKREGYIAAREMQIEGLQTLERKTWSQVEVLGDVFDRDSLYKLIDEFNMLKR